MRAPQRLAAALVLICTALTASLPMMSAGAATMPDPGVTGCDVLVATPSNHSCLLPWPNDAFTKKASTLTGREMNISASATPMNVSGVHINPHFQNINDGFSPGSEVLINIPNLSFTQSGIATSTTIGSSLSSNAPVVLFDTVTHQNVPYFAEMDAQSTDASAQLLLIHPATNFLEGHRIDVVLRGLKNGSGAYLPQLAGETAALNGSLKPATRGAHLKWIVTSDLKSLNTSHLYAAWDFTVATGGGNLSKLSASNIADPALSMRQQAYKLVGTTTPVFQVTGTSVNGNGERQVTGIYQVPTFLKNCPTTGNAMFGSTDTSKCESMSTDKSGLPALIPSTLTAASAGHAAVWTNQLWANFICVMPQTMGSVAATPSLYGHGLLGDAWEVTRGNFRYAATGGNMMGCATDWSGMSNNDTLMVAGTLNDMSYFHYMTDHMLQGLVNFQFLGRLINSSRGFATDPAFQSGTGSTAVSRFLVGKCNYTGYSQGGIMGGALSAISNEWSRAVIGQPGLNYGGLLLNRSVDWSEFSAVYNPAYPNSTDQQVGLQLAQLLWDRGENDGYAEHLTKNPYGGTKVKQIFIVENYGDHQVSNMSQEVLARTIGAAAHAPAFNATYLLDSSVAVRTNLPVTSLWGLPVLNQTKSAPAALVLWDFGTPTPPTVNTAPSGASYGHDPHDYGHNNAGIIAEMQSFFATGVVPDVCAGAACQAPPVN
ncbi:MAG: hypothetical protein WCG86_02575 [Actinomycetota bacterium]